MTRSGSKVATGVTFLTYREIKNIHTNYVKIINRLKCTKHVKQLMLLLLQIVILVQLLVSH